jgi:CBS domain-containing protein
MKVQDLMTRDVGTCRPFAGADEGARVMWERDCGAVPIVDQEGRVVAMLTDRDVCMAALTQGRALSEIRIASAMSRSLWCCRPEDELSQAEEVMKSRKVRRLPVVDGDGKLLGILSLSDLARAATGPKKSRAKTKTVGLSEVGETLAAINSAAEIGR